MVIDNVAPTAQLVTWYTKSKTRAPKFSISLVARQRLLDRLDKGLNGAFSFIAAPAGYGKSSLLSQWRASLIERRVKCAWINLDEDDREIRKFLAYITFSLTEAGVDLGELQAEAERGFIDLSSDAIASRLLFELERLDDKLVLILDDYHRLNSPHADRFLHDAQNRCGDRLHIAIGSRGSVISNRPALLAAGNAIEITAFDLKFSDDEVEKAVGEAVDALALQAFQEKIEGWPVAVQMLRLLGQGNAPLHDALGSFHGHSGHIGDYLASQVVESLPEDLQQFVLKTAFLKRFNTALADEICGHDQSRDMLRRLEPLNALIVPMDDDLDWRRYHHLFSEFLRDLLKRKNPAEYEALHRKAAKWCDAHRYIAEAVGYANAIEDYSLSIEIILKNGGWMLSLFFGGVGYLKGLLHDIPDSEIEKNPRLLYAKAYIAIRAGEYKQAGKYCDAARALADQKEETPDLRRDRLCIGSLVQGYLETGLERDSDVLEQHLGEAAPGDEFIHGALKTIISLKHLAYADFDLAHKYASEAAHALQLPDNYQTECYAFMSLGILGLYQGDHGLAVHNLEHSVSLASQYYGSRSNMALVGSVCLLALQYWRGDLDEDGAAALEQALLSTLHCDGWFDTYAIGFDALLHYADFADNEKTALNALEKLSAANLRYGVDRLDYLTTAFKLQAFTRWERFSEAKQQYEKIRETFSSDDLNNQDKPWFTSVAAAFASAKYLAATGDADHALCCLSSAVEFCRRLNARPYMARGLALKAEILFDADQSELAFETLVNALCEAAPLQYAQPFLAVRSRQLFKSAVTQAVSNGNISAHAKALARRVLSENAGSGSILSPREQEIIEKLAAGQSNKEIARHLGLTENTIKFHLKKVYSKLGVSRRVNAVSRARELGVIS